MRTTLLMRATWLRNRFPRHDLDLLRLRLMNGLASTSIRTIPHGVLSRNHSFSSAHDPARCCSPLWMTASLALCSIASGIAGYALCSRNDSAGEHKDDQPRFGTPEDFGRAIRELTETFTEDGVVSTDAEDLRIHGFSEYDYHPGQCLTRRVSS